MRVVMDEKRENEQPINEFFVFLSVDNKGNEGLVGGVGLDGKAFSLAFGYEHTARSFLPMIKEMAKVSGMQIKFVKFTQREVLETVG